MSKNSYNLNFTLQVSAGYQKKVEMPILKTMLIRCGAVLVRLVEEGHLELLHFHLHRHLQEPYHLRI